MGACNVEFPACYENQRVVWCEHLQDLTFNKRSIWKRASLLVPLMHPCLSPQRHPASATRGIRSRRTRTTLSDYLVATNRSRVSSTKAPFDDFMHSTLKFARRALRVAEPRFNPFRTFGCRGGGLGNFSGRKSTNSVSTVRGDRRNTVLGLLQTWGCQRPQRERWECHSPDAI